MSGIPEIVLTQMEISPFCDKVRRVLHYKKLPFRTREIGIANMHVLKKLAPPAKVPVLEYGKDKSHDSTDICLFLEQRHPSPALLPEHAAQKAEVLLLEDWADESLYFFEMTMRFVWPEDRKRWSLEMAKRDASPIRAAAPFLLAHLTRTITRHQGTGRKNREHLLQDLNRLFDALETRISQTGFCVGSAISLADIAVAAQIHCIQGSGAGAEAVARHAQLHSWKQRIDQLTLPTADGAANASLGA